ncbi:MAG: hypothetical protein UET83_07235, partial [Eubacteriales bacterium]|nr:hypothetical protein [Eubacteriales bacterium]
IRVWSPLQIRALWFVDFCVMKRSPKIFRTSFNSLFRNRKISAPSVDRTAPQCYNKVILEKRKREVIYYEKP